MTLSEAQRLTLEHLRAAYVGPSGGPEEVTFNRPSLQYSVGMLFPLGSSSSSGGTGTESDVIDGEIEESSAAPPLAEDWRPSSAAISFVTNLPRVAATVTGGTYEVMEDDGPPGWRRRPFTSGQLELTLEEPARQLTAGDVRLELGSRWRPYGSYFLVTVHIRLHTKSKGGDKEDIPGMLFQVGLEVEPDPQGGFLEYRPTGPFEMDLESAELSLRYRNRMVYAVGHGMAADWELEAGVCRKVMLDPVPAFIVPAIETTGFQDGTREAKALMLSHLASLDRDPEPVLESLDSFVAAFSDWVSEQEARVLGFGDQQHVAAGIVERSRAAADRMGAGVDLLREGCVPGIRRAFALGMEAMRLQMQQAAKNRGEVDATRPQWRPFQLGFLLVSLASTVDVEHADRELVDLIWFPTGGGKTEAYLGLAAVEIFRRRLVRGVGGGGTAVITRYTLRLLTAQQFQRAAALICAMEMMRESDQRVAGMAPFSIGLWVGNEATPGTRAEARKALDRLYKAAHPEDANQFQVQICPWCGAKLIPDKRTSDLNQYGMRVEGEDVVLCCPSRDCVFKERLPLVVVDELLYEAPPTILLATVDKFARLQFKPESGRLLGLGTPFLQPSLVIQDELHLLSGPLGTTVAVFDAVIQLLLSRKGTKPKIIASTATIRASHEQVKGLYGRNVVLYPPSGLDDDRTFFSRPVGSGHGRLYVGLMPQSVSQATALVAAAAPLIELPVVLSRAETQHKTSRDAYWTLVAYHNSLRELGRTGTLMVDDVNGRLETRAERDGRELRPVRASRVLELTSRRSPEELPGDLRALEKSVVKTDQAVDVVLSSNMLSVGIDVPRLALMLMVGQPKTTAEYIQATSRVGRGGTRGIVVTLFRSNRARDRSHFETFRAFHDSLYRTVEPTSVTPWSLASRDRSLAGALVALIRQSFQRLAPDVAAKYLDLKDESMRSGVEEVVERLLHQVERADAVELQEARQQMWSLLREWDLRAVSAREEGTYFRYERQKAGDDALLKRFGQAGQGWLVGDSMRSVEPNVAVQVREPMQEA